MGVYGLITQLRNYAFDKQIACFKTKTFPQTRIVCVGNLSVGGTGKTPMVIYLAHHFIAKDLKVVIMSRGYKREKRGDFFAQTSNDARQIGDEPALYINEFKEHFGKNLFVYLCGRRDRGVENILKEKPDIDIVLLDDGFQHRYIRANKNILLTTFYKPFFSDKILPYGRLRESKKGKDRADIFVVTKCPKEMTLDKKNDFIKKCNPLPSQKVFFTSIRYDKVIGEGQSIDVDIFCGDPKTKAILVTGIASAQAILDYIKEKNVVLLRHFEFGDHHSFTTKEIEEIERAYNLLDEPILLTTEKDFIRIKAEKESFPKLPWRYLSIAPQILFNQEEEFLKEIERN